MRLENLVRLVRLVDPGTLVDQLDPVRQVMVLEDLGIQLDRLYQYYPENQLDLLYQLDLLDLGDQQHHRDLPDLACQLDLLDLVFQLRLALPEIPERLEDLEDRDFHRDLLVLEDQYFL